MDDYVIVWDLETVPDLAAVARINGLPVTETSLVREALGEKFQTSIPLHRVHWRADRAAHNGSWPMEVVALGAPHIGYRTRPS